MTLSPGIWAALLLTPVLISSGQILFKMASGRLKDGVSGFAGLLSDPYFVLAIVIYAVGTFVWIYALKAVPLNKAYPFMAMTFCLVPIASSYFFGEPMTLKYWSGVGLILAGMLVINV